MDGYRVQTTQATVRTTCNWCKLPIEVGQSIALLSFAGWVHEKCPTPDVP